MKMHKKMTNLEIAKLFRAVAAAYQLKGEDKFRTIAYQNASVAIEHSTSELKDLWDEGKIDEIPGVGKKMIEHLDELFRTGKVKHFEDLIKGFPEAMFELMEIPGIGAKTAFKLTKELGITRAKNAVKKLEEAAKEGRISKIEGFGKESEAKILQSIEEVKSREKRFLLPYAAKIAEDIVDWLKRNPQVIEAEPLGSLRRQVSTVGDIDIAVSSKNSRKVIEHFVRYPKKSKIIEKGNVTASIKLPSGVQVDLMVQPPDSFGSLLQHFTGSKQHNIKLRTYALKKGLSLSEYGIQKGGKLYKTETEEDFYKTLGMVWIPPELREDTGEIEAAVDNKIPDLVKLEDLKGDFHIHSNFWLETSHDPGVNSMEEYIKEAERLGYQYLAFSEHNPKISEKKSKILDMLKRKKEKIDQLNYSRETNENIRVKKIFNSLEVDIRPNGELSLPEEGFELIDFAIASLHSSFKGSKKAQTARVLKSLKNPKVKIFGHPTARKINEREGVDLEWEEVFEFCLKYKKWLEINSWPERLDLPDVLVRDAVKRGVKLVICTDSHAVEHMNGIRYGVSVARRGWAEKKDIINTLPYDKIIKEF